MKEQWEKFSQKILYQKKLEEIGPINAQIYKPGVQKKVTDGYKAIRRKVEKFQVQGG